MIKAILKLSGLSMIVACQSGSDIENTLGSTNSSDRVKNEAVQITSVQASVQAALKDIERHRKLNAFISINAEGALNKAKQIDKARSQGEAQGPLSGMLLVAKDNIHIAGIPNTAGTPALSEYVPVADSPVVAKLRAAGAIFIAKTNLHELAFGITSDNTHFGSVANPSDTSKIAGGSSGGTAAAVASGIVSAGLGTDTGGSVRIPAALTGISALRPTIGRYSSEGVTPVSSTRDTIGPMAKTVADLIKLDSVITDHAQDILAADLTSLRLGVPKAYFFDNLDPQTAKRTEWALSKLEAAGVTLLEVDVPDVGESIEKSAFPIALYEVIRDIPEYLAANNIDVSFDEIVANAASPDVQGVFAAAIAKESAIPDAIYKQAMEARAHLQNSYKKYFADNDLDGLIFPTTILPARPIEGSLETVELNGERLPTFNTYIHNTDPASIAGIPGISVPIGETDNGLPVGIEVDGPKNSDRRLLSIALALETLFGF